MIIFSPNGSVRAQIFDNKQTENDTHFLVMLTCFQHLNQIGIF